MGPDPFSPKMMPVKLTPVKLIESTPTVEGNGPQWNCNQDQKAPSDSTATRKMVAATLKDTIAGQNE